MKLPEIPKKVILHTQIPDHYWYGDVVGHTDAAVKSYGQQCALAERERILKIAYEQSTAYGKTGECMWIGIKAHVRNGK